VVLEALRAGQHKNIYCGVLRVRKMRYYIKNYSSKVHSAPSLSRWRGARALSLEKRERRAVVCYGELASGCRHALEKSDVLWWDIIDG
jgi:hypothetical protein